MRKGDFVWLAIWVIVAIILIYPATHNVFITMTTNHPYIMGFIKFFILASMGDWLGGRVIYGEWRKPAGAIYRSIIWGIIGMCIALAFPLYAAGVAAVMKLGLLPGANYPLAVAFFISLTNNLTFGVALMCAHRVSDTYIELSATRKVRPTMDEVINNLGANNLFKFVLFKVVPFFWVPAHTITFMLPPEYRVLFAAVLGIALGFFLSYAKKKSMNETKYAASEAV